jgi:DNA-directed RNA polymerase subunit beta'
VVNRVTQEVLVRKNEVISPDQARRIEALGVDRLMVRSPINCRAPGGVCQLCYGTHPASGSLVELGTAVGILAAQSLANPDLGPTTRIYAFGPPREPSAIAILALASGKVRFEDVVEGRTLWQEESASRCVGQRITEHQGDLFPRIVLENDAGRVLHCHHLPAGARIEVTDGEWVSAGTLLARASPKDGCRDVPVGMPAVLGLLEARHPRCRATLAESGGIVSLGERKEDGSRTVFIWPVDDRGHKVSDGPARGYRIPPVKHLYVIDGDRVEAGRRLDEGTPSPHDLLRVLGPQEAGRFLLEEVQQIYRCLRCAVDDKHVEIIVAQMLRSVQVRSSGDTLLLPGAMVDRTSFETANGRLGEGVKIADPGDSQFANGQVVGRGAFDQERARLEAAGRSPPTAVRPVPATARTQLRGITSVGEMPESFLAAAALPNRAARVLAGAALAGRIDPLAGLKENVILGRLIPAGTGFPTGGQE